ncbi:MAG TPA: ATP-dependent helicase [Elusimicrobia bacterium]|nr:ATP-dependent helicase [Elusimicrobiota bacterium]
MPDLPVNPAIAVNPRGHLYWDSSGGEETWPDGLAAVRTEKAFSPGSAQGLLHLVSRELDTPLPAGVSFWRELGRRYLSAFCRGVMPGATDMPPSLPPPEDELRSWLERLPPMKGGEYLTAAALAEIWTGFDAYVRTAAAAHPGGPAEFIKLLNPAWHSVGRVVFHLAENPKNGNYPFAFLATYAAGMSGHGRLKYQPLAEALKEYAGEDNKAALLRLLSPVRSASEKSALARELLETGALFKPLAWTPPQAYRFLKEAPILAEGGVIVRLPDWWRASQAPRARVNVKLGNAAGTALGLNTLLDFTVEKSLDGEPLTDAEWEALMRSSGGLALIRGRWVEADAEKLGAALEHWEKMKRSANEGVTLAEAMRMLSGANIDGAPEDGAGNAAVKEWSGIKAGTWLEATLAKLREPGKAGEPPSAPGLLAVLRPYQKTGVGWLRFMTELGLGACLADDMGLGKTVQVLALLLARKAARRAGRPSLLVAPASLLTNWRAEILRFAPGLKHRILHPSELSAEDWKAAQKDFGKAAAGCDLVLTTYGLVARLESLRKTRWDVVALDEAQAIKNPAARQSRAVKELDCAQRLVLTGTPVENRLGDLWSIFDFLNPGLLGSATRFGEFIKSGPQDGCAPGALRALVKPYILRRMKTDKSVIADLPDKTEVKTYCGLAPKQAALYGAAIRELAEKLENAEGMARRGLVLAYLTRFKQICNHPSHWLRDGGYAEAESGKFQRLRAIAEEIASRQEKALVFTQYQEMTGPLLEFLAGIFGRAGLALHGGTPVKARRGLVDAFQAENGPPFFVLTAKAGGSGLNLTEASHVIHFDRWWNPAVENQATDRAFRIGQKRNVLVHKFVCRGTLEERIDEMLTDKARLADSVIGGGGEKLLTEMNNQDLLKFVALDINRAAQAQ